MQLFVRMFFGDKMDGILLINKPSGYTSHDVVNKVRKALHTKKVGHCGTLDPDATGVLVVCVNKATKALQFLTSDTKEYIATLSLGIATDTYDASGKALQQMEYQPMAKETIEAVIQSFCGKQQQIPPIYSAIKVNGKKLYEYARNGESVELAPRDIEIFEIELLQIHENTLQFRVLCSKGTYIRSLCVDIAKKLGYPGHMQSLIRSKSGSFCISQCYTLEQVEAGKYSLLSIDEALANYPKVYVEDESIVYHGKKIKSAQESLVAICNRDGHILAIYGPDGNGYLKNIRGLW